VHPRATTYPVAPDLSSLSRCAQVLPHVLQPRTLPSCRGGLRCCHVSRGPGPRLLAELSSGAATCSLAPDLTSLLRWTLVLPCVPWLWALHSREESSGAATCSSTLNLASLPRLALALLRVPRLQALPPRDESSGAATYPTAPNGLWTTRIKKAR
jgi:hypothetical protein